MTRPPSDGRSMHEVLLAARGVAGERDAAGLLHRLGEQRVALAPPLSGPR